MAHPKATTAPPANDGKRRPNRRQSMPASGETTVISRQERIVGFDGIDAGQPHRLQTGTAILPQIRCDHPLANRLACQANAVKRRFYRRRSRSSSAAPSCSVSAFGSARLEL
jgi:hypothetical protein